MSIYLNLEYFNNFSELKNCFMADQASNKLLEDYEEATKNIINSHITASMCTSIVGELITLISLLTAPFTGGTSVMTVAALGATIELVGGFYRILIYAIDMFMSKDFEKNILKILFSGYFKSIQAYELLQNLKLSKHFSSFGLCQGGKLWKEMREYSEFIKDNLFKIGINIGKHASLKIVRNATIIYFLIFILWDVKELVDILSKNHPQADYVAELINSFNKSLQRV